MNTIRKIALTALAAAMLASISGCGGMSVRDRNTVAGAAIGGVAGSALTGGDALGTVGGAAVGGVIGHQIRR